jgi:RHS repeat-associated protein
MHTKLHTENTFHARRCADKKPSRLHAPRAAIPAGTKISIRRKCEKRLLKINYPGSGNNSQFTYDGFSHLVQIVETVSGTVSSTKQFVRVGNSMYEARNASGTVTAQYFSLGQTASGSNYLYQLNQRGDIVGVTNSSGTLVSVIMYDAYGRLTVVSGTLISDFGLTGLYQHQPSGLNFAVYRAYNPNFGRWINRDPIGEDAGANLYGYINNEPIPNRDSLGLFRDNDGIGASPTPIPLPPGDPVFPIPLMPPGGYPTPIPLVPIFSPPFAPIAVPPNWMWPPSWFPPRNKCKWWPDPKQHYPGAFGSPYLNGAPPGAPGGQPPGFGGNYNPPNTNGTVPPPPTDMRGTPYIPAPAPNWPTPINS